MATTIEWGFNFRNKRFQRASVGLAAFAKELDASWDGAAKSLSRQLKSFLDSVAEAIAQRHSTPWPGGTGEHTLSKRSGALVASIEKSVRIEGSTYNDLKGYIGAAFPAQVHEYGATIRPKKAKFLTVPLPAALDSRGVPEEEVGARLEKHFRRQDPQGQPYHFSEKWDADHSALRAAHSGHDPAASRHAGYS